MRAIKYNQFGSPSDVLYVANVDMPFCKRDEVLIRMLFRAINPSDILTIKGTYPNRIILPASPGYEGVGVIVEKGSAVNHLSIGQRVLGLRGTWVYSSHLSPYSSQAMHSSGTWQEYITMNAQGVISIPDEIDNATAAQLYINPLTAWLMLKNELKIQPGDIVIANACGSAIGRIFAEYASIFGYELIGVTRNDAYTKILNKLGIRKVINTSKEPLLESLLSYTKGKKVTAALDAIGGEEGIKLAHCVQDGGTMLLYGLLSGQQYPQDIRISLTSKVTIKNYWLRNWVNAVPLEERKSVFSDMLNQFIRHQINLSSGLIFDLDDIKKAVETSEASNRTCKVLLSG